MPLGSPQRMSPVITPVDHSPSESKTKDATAAPLQSAPASSPAKHEENGHAPSSERPKKEKKNKDKKSKLTSKSTESTEEAKVNRVYTCASVVLLSMSLLTDERIRCSG